MDKHVNILFYLRTYLDSDSNARRDTADVNIAIEYVVEIIAFDLGHSKCQGQGYAYFD